MFWVVPSLFALCAGLLVFALLGSLREAEETYAGEYSKDTARQFEDLFLFIPPEKILRLMHVAALVVFLMVFMVSGNLTSLTGIVRGVIAGGIGCAVIYTLPQLVIKILRKRRVERFNAQLANALDGMSNALKAGFSIQQAFETIVQEGENPIAQEFGMFLQQLRVGVTFENALSDMERRVGSDDLTLMIQSIEIARQTGGNLTEVFERIADTIRERRTIEGKIESLTAQGRIQGRVVGLMPLIMGIVLYFLDPQMMLMFVRSMAGIIILCLIFILEILGFVFIRRIVNIDV